MSEKTTTRSTKEERRREIVEAAVHEFAVYGLYGTPVEAIAKRVGVSQPYLFQLFGTKKDLFIAAMRRGFQRTVAVFRQAAAEAGPEASTEDILMTMGIAYANLLESDREILLMQLQAYAASEDEEVRAAVREEFLRLVRFVQSASGAPDEAIRPWLAEGMLMTVAAALSLVDVEEDWARMCTGRWLLEHVAELHQKGLSVKDAIHAKAGAIHAKANGGGA